MKNAKISKIHCEECKEDLIHRMRELLKTDQVHYDNEEESLSFPSHVPREDVEKILGAEKIRILPDKGDSHEEDHHDHDHGHDHHHGHHHHHHSHRTGEDAEKGMRIVFFLNLFFSIGEFIFGGIFRSAAIQADAIHDLGDALSIGLVWIFQRISTRHSNESYSFGHKRFSLFGALITSVVLIVGAIFAIVNAIPRFFNPVEIHHQGMTLVAVVAILINGIAVWILSKGRSKNESLLNLHMLEDLAGWVVILVIGIILRFRPWYFLDSLASIGIALFILKEAIPAFKEIIEIFLEAVPEGVELKKLKEEISQVEGVHGMSHLHFWSMDGEEHNFTVTVFTTRDSVEELEEIRKSILNLIAPYDVTCSTIEVNYDPEKWNQGYFGE